jgi:hypothetical protein
MGQARAATAVLRDPLVPLDFGGWVQRTLGVVRRDVRGLTLLALAPTLLGVLEQLTIEVIRPSMADIKFQLEAAANASPTGFVDQWTVFRISVLPLIPTMMIFSVLIGVTAAFGYGATYHRAVRRANGQPISLSWALRAAAPRVPALLGWSMLVVFGTLAIFALLLVPGTVTANPWLNVVGPLLGFLLVILATVFTLPTLCGAVFVDRAGLGRCVRLVTGRFWATAARASAICGGLALYIVATTLTMKLMLVPFGGASNLSMVGRAVVLIVQGISGLPVLGYLAATTLVSYAELRFYDDPATTTRTLAMLLSGNQSTRATVTNSL